jgi:phage terminase large subunit
VRTLQIPTAEVFAPLLAPARYKAAKGGRGSGKSHFFGGLLIEDCLAEPGNSGEGMRAVCIREVQKDLAQSSKLLLESKLHEHKLGEADGFKVYRDLISVPGDGIVIFKGMNDYNSDSIKSLEGFKRAWWEEAQTATLHSLNLLRPTLRASGSQLWFGWNPRRKTDPVRP